MADNQKLNVSVDEVELGGVTTDTEKDEETKQFFQENKQLLRHFGMLQNYDESSEFLKAHIQLVNDNSVKYLVMWCLNLEMEEKHDVMARVAHQAICLQYIMEFINLNFEPSAIVDVFFKKVQLATHQAKQAFNTKLEEFKEKIKRRVNDKINEVLNEFNDVVKNLDPNIYQEDVYESLPEDLKKCLDTKNYKLLKETISKMKKEQRDYYMKELIESGLWAPEETD